MKTNYSPYFLLLLLVLPIVTANIEISNIKDKYNLGENLLPKIEITLDQDFKGFQKTKIDCDKELTYYAVPKTIKKGKTIVEIPALETYEEIMGDCKITFILENLDGSIYEKEISNEFKISNKLIFELEQLPSSLNPSEILTLKGTLYNIRNEPILGILKASLEDQTYNYFIENSINAELKISDSIDLGTKKLILTFEDNLGNFIEKELLVIINSIPTSIEIKFNKEEYDPNEKLTANILLLDQADKIIQNKEMTIKLLGHSTTQTSGQFEYNIDNSFEPGEYTLEASHNQIRKEYSFKIQEIKQIITEIQNQTVIIKNIGNVNYDSPTQIILENDNKEIILEESLDLNPNEIKEIDLSKETPEGDYLLTLPDNTTTNITLDDNRNILKKSAQGITGAFSNVGTSGNILAGLIVLALIVALVIGAVKFLEIPSVGIMKTKNEDKKHIIKETHEPFTHEERAHMKNRIKILEKKLEK